MDPGARLRRRGPRSRFDRVYSVVVALKGVDGSIELVLGLLLLIAPAAVGQVVEAAADELGEGPSPALNGLARSMTRTADAVGTGSGLLLGVFLVLHGVVKLATVVFLLRRIVRAYPWAIAALGALTVLQVVDLVVQPNPGGVLLLALDVVVIALVAAEYRRLRRRPAGP